MLASLVSDLPMLLVAVAFALHPTVAYRVALALARYGHRAEAVTLAHIGHAPTSNRDQQNSTALFRGLETTPSFC